MRHELLYVQAAAGDAGGALGAAIHAWHQVRALTPVREVRTPVALAGDRLEDRTIMEAAYLGPGAREEDIAALLSAHAADLERASCRVERMADESALCRSAAEAIAAGSVVGWFQGRMEWGPRALGNRSILCDPRRADMKDILNLKIKRRESFRPFAPSVLREHVPLWFEEDDDVPFMMQVYQVREERRALVPAVTHVDGSGRLQTVCRQHNSLYWQLIEAFRRITGVPMVLNTSFNENEPVVCRPEEALDCFLRTRMDVLVMGRFFLLRRQPEADPPAVSE